MPALLLLWQLSAILVVTIVLMLIALVLFRLLGPLREAGREARRLQLVMLLSKVEWTAADQARLSRAPPGLVADVCIELLQMVRGDQKDRIVDAGRRAGVVEILCERLKSWSHGVRLGAAEALGDFVDDPVADALGAALEDPVPTVRLAAAISLTGVGRAPPLRMLIDKLELGTAECSRFILKLFRDRAAAGPDEVKALLADEGVSDTVKGYAAEALAAAGDHAAVAAIASLVLDGETDRSTMAGYVQVLGELAHPDAADAIEYALRSDHWQVRASAADAAGKIRLSSSIDTLTALLADSHWLVRLRASEALGKLGAAGRSALTDTSRTAHGPAREAAAIELAQRIA